MPAAATLGPMVADASRLEITEAADDRYLFLSGELDSHTADGLAARLQVLGPRADVVLDVSSLVFVDSSGLRTIIDAHHHHDAAGTRLVLADPSEAVTRLLDLAGLVGRLHVEP